MKSAYTRILDDIRWFDNFYLTLFEGRRTGHTLASAEYMQAEDALNNVMSCVLRILEEDGLLNEEESSLLFREYLNRKYQALKSHRRWADEVRSAIEVSA